MIFMYKGFKPSWQIELINCGQLLYLLHTSSSLMRLSSTYFFPIISFTLYFLSFSQFLFNAILSPYAYTIASLLRICRLLWFLLYLHFHLLHAVKYSLFPCVCMHIQDFSCCYNYKSCIQNCYNQLESLVYCIKCSFYLSNYLYLLSKALLWFLIFNLLLLFNL